MSESRDQKLTKRDANLNREYRNNTKKPIKSEFFIITGPDGKKEKVEKVDTSHLDIEQILKDDLD